jgi:hypothetical protein
MDGCRTPALEPAEYGIDVEPHEFRAEAEAGHAVRAPFADDRLTDVKLMSKLASSLQHFLLFHDAGLLRPLGSNFFDA